MHNLHLCNVKHILTTTGLLPAKVTTHKGTLYTAKKQLYRLRLTYSLNTPLTFLVWKYGMEYGKNFSMEEIWSGRFLIWNENEME